jgi:hypothetical protein
MMYTLYTNQFRSQDREPAVRRADLVEIRINDPLPIALAVAASFC